MRIAIIGAGFGGIAAAVKLQQAGLNDFTIFEKSAGIGGTWWDNRYPGAATDAASHIYSFSFAPHDWERTHVGQAELQRYLEDVVDRFALRSRIRLQTSIVSAIWEPARHGYVLTLADGETDFYQSVISAVGMFSKPRYPNWPGLEDFAGPVLHTAKWDPSIDLKGKRVAVVGTGSSAAQVVPALVDQVAHLTLFQRQPGWLLPKRDRGFTDRERGYLRHGLWRKYYRFKLYAVQEMRELRGAFFRPGARPNTQARLAALAYIDEVFADRPDLKAAVTPNYPFAGKRAVMSSDFFPALKRPNVALVPKAVVSCRPDALVDADGGVHPADALVLATGFEVTEYLSTLKVVGRQGDTLSARWKGEPHAFLGIMVPGFPNFFMLYGPNTNGGFIVTNLERQARFALLEIKRLVRAGKPETEVTDAANTRYNDWLQGQMTGTAFIEGQNYFKTASGRVVTQWPDNASVYGFLLFALRRFTAWRRRQP
ncbi:flavin-containing monooxygenase [uncultured Devosia sp.]|uniref:flavin-containing monooxygenase n=1 Tax=uncultured Devosia sp. TaxID=211434 RepID=UPI0035CAD1FD